MRNGFNDAVCKYETLIAVSSLINIVFDIHGNQINRINDPIAHITPCFITVFPQNGNTYVLLSYFRKHKHIYKFIKDQITNQPIDLQKIIITNIIAMYCENVAISPDSWENLNGDIQNSYKRIFTERVLSKESLLSYPKLNIFV